MSHSIEDRLKRDLVARYEMSWQFPSVKINELGCQAVFGGVCSVNFGEIVTIKFLNK